MDEVEPLRAAREALARHEWQAAYDAFLAADHARQPEDDEAMADAAFWSGHPVDAFGAYQRAYAGYVEDGRPGEAASAALQLAALHFMRGDESVAAGWFGRAQRLLDALPECAAHAQLAWLESMMLALTDGGLALQRVREAEAIATRVGNRDLVGLAISLQGQVRTRGGDVSGGMALLDEALASAIAGELGPWATAEIFC
ncbi:MAG: hypothetical protein MUP67_02990, partial [Acidimicrobiia bacterium]|nr:hypothetical protein [Acidimicrobiia bacterium]